MVRKPKANPKPASERASRINVSLPPDLARFFAANGKSRLVQRLLREERSRILGDKPE